MMHRPVVGPMLPTPTLAPKILSEAMNEVSGPIRNEDSRDFPSKGTPK